MSDKRRATRYGAFFESAEKPVAAPAKRKSPARVEAPAKKETRKSPARVETIVKKETKEAKKETKRVESPVKKERKASKSPARGRPVSKSRKPSKSPARVPKKESKAVVKKEEPKETKAKATKKGKTSPSIVIEKISSKQMSPKSKAKAAKAVVTEVDSDFDLSPLPKRRTRQDTAAEKKSQSASVSHSVVDASPEYSDQDIGDNEISFRRRGTSKLDELKEFGGSIGCAVLLLAYPLIAYSLQYNCNIRFCGFRQPNWADFKSLSTYYNLDLVKIVIPFILGVTTLNIFPLGRVAKIHTDRGYAEYQYNGLTLSIVTVSAIIGAEYLKYPVVDVIFRNYNQLLLIMILNAIVQSIHVFIRSRYVAQSHWNPFAKTGCVIQDFFVGREINPKVFSLIDVKLVHYHLSLITTLVLNGIFIYKNVKLPQIQTELPLSWQEKAWSIAQNAKFEVVPLVLSLLIILYVLDLLIFEHHLSKTFELQYEGVGAGLLLRYAVSPFTFSLIAKYALDYKLKVQWWILTIVALEFIAALVIKRLANKAKHDFRLNPTSNKSLALKTIPTFQGRRLLVDGLWKIVRQPNYTAEILIHTSLLLVLIGRFALPPLLATLFTVLTLIHRSVRLDDRHANRYESAWQRYCQEVKNILLPRIY